LIKKVSILLFCWGVYLNVNAQDPFLSQAHGAAQFLNPATVGTGVFASRLQSNYRSQLFDGVSLIKTIVVGWDTKINNQNPEVKNYLGVGGVIISDQLMNGVFQTNYATLNAAYHMFFDKDVKRKLALGMGVTFAQSSLQLNRLKFYDQFNQGSFTENSQSISLQNLKGSASSVSVSSGLLYTSHLQTSFMQMGASAFFVTKPEMSISKDYGTSSFKSVMFFNFEKESDDNDKTFMLHASFNQRSNSKQSKQVLVGGAISFPFGNNYEYINRIYTGLFYRVGDAVIPQVTILLNKHRFGLSYDFFSKIATSAELNRTCFEFSFSTSFGKRKFEYLRTVFD
jgi:type IX secretion system PorP/SprF family membrane protein